MSKNFQGSGKWTKENQPTNTLSDKYNLFTFLQKNKAIPIDLVAIVCNLIGYEKAIQPRRFRNWLKDGVWRILLRQRLFSSSFTRHVLCPTKHNRVQYSEINKYTHLTRKNEGKRKHWEENPNSITDRTSMPQIFHRELNKLHQRYLIS